MDSARLTRLRAGSKAAVTKLTKDLNVWVTSASQDAIKAKRGSLEKALTTISSYNEQLYDIYDDDTLTASMEEDMRYEEMIGEKIAFLDRHLNSAPTTMKEKEKSSVKLPALQLPTFEGQSRLWTGFWDLFSCSVHDRRDLTDIQKFTYLKGQLVGEPSRLISGFNLEGANYQSAVQLLRDTYGQTDQIKADHITSFYHLTKPQYNVLDLKKFHAEFECALKSIKALNVTMDELCVVMLFDKLPSPMREILRRNLKEDWLDLDKFIKAFNEEVHNLEVSNEEPNFQKEAIPTAAFAMQRAIPDVKHYPRRETSSQASAGCRLCGKAGHYWYTCHKYSNPASKVKRARELRLCIGCLDKEYGKKGCINPKVHPCKYCKGKHYHSLCPNKRVETSKEERSNTEQPTVTMSVSSNKEVVLLPTIRIPLSGENKRMVKVRSLLDQCSQKTFIVRSTLPLVKYKRAGQETLQLRGFTGDLESKVYDVVKLQYQHKGKWRNLNAVVVDTLPTYHVTKGLSKLMTQLTQGGMKLADADCYSNGELGMLIGADNYYRFVHPGYKTVQGVRLLPTIYGFALSGSYHSNDTATNVEVVTVLKVVTNEVHDMFGRVEEGNSLGSKDVSILWELDHIGIKPQEEDSKSEVLTQFNECVQYDARNKQYTVALPWKINKHLLPNNYNLALGRLRGLQRKFAKDSDYFEKYNQVLQDQVERGFIEKVKENRIQNCHYLAHHGVKKDSVTTPVRIVFDCSAKSSNRQLSLNDCLHTGPSFVTDLTQLLLRFRLHKYACVSDIEKAFLMLKLNEEDTEYTRFLWPKNPFDVNSEVDIYKFNVVLFGATCSQFLLNATILKHLSMVQDQGTVSTLKRGLYIDNLQMTNDNEEGLLNISHQAQNIFSTANLHLREWTSNSSSIQKQMKLAGLAADNQEQIKTLGLLWLTKKDILMLPIKSDYLQANTKREALSVIASVFDPLGILLPVTIKARQFMQDLWRSNYSWDDNLPDVEKERWHEITTNISHCAKISITRQVTQSKDVTLHIFSDASTTAYGAAAYFVSQGTSKLVMAKAKVAPLKSITLPRLELTAVLLASRLFSFIDEAYKQELNIIKTIIWSDSQITLCWLASQKQLPVYVRNRVQEIHKLAPSVEFKYIPTKDNPGDLLTRGVSSNVLMHSLLWWEGPSWLPHSELWPDGKTAGPHPVVALSVEDEVQVKEGSCQGVFEWNRFGSYNKVLRVTGWIKRFIGNIQAKMQGIGGRDGSLTIPELRAAERDVVRLVQAEVYLVERNELEKKGNNKGLIRQLGLYLDKGVIRCKGRIGKAHLSYNTRYPMLLPNKHPVTSLIIMETHKLCYHYGVGYVVAYLRTKWWIPKIRQRVKTVTRACVKCKRFQGKSYEGQPSPPLPEFRVQQAEPFHVTGVDFTGPLSVKTENGMGKVYIVLFTCAVTRAIHLEVVPNLTCESFIHAFRRFSSRRGFPRIMLSDNATTFINAAKVMKDKFNSNISDTKIQHGCEWRFIPARAPWFGSIWERAIGIVKAGLKKVLGRAIITLTELGTILTELEAAVNDRPLGYVSGDLEDPIPITPSQLISGRRIRMSPEPLGVDEIADPSIYTSDSLSARFNYVNKLSSDLWRRWIQEYLLALRETHGNLSNNSKKTFPQIGDIVLIHKENSRLFWRLGLITKLFRGIDEHHRVAQVKTATGVISRPVIKLYPLEVNCGDSGEARDDELGTAGRLGSEPPTSGGNDGDSRTPRRAALGSQRLWRSLISGGDI